MLKQRIILILGCLLTTLYSVYATQNQPYIEDTISEIIVVNERIAALQGSRSVQLTSFYMKQLEQEQRLSYKDLSAAIPNLYIPDYGSRMTSTIYMRGLGARIDNPVLGLYIDGVGIANKNSYDFDLFDIRSVRVASGPQGTLFGRNTIGGMMTIQTLSPLDWQGFRATIGYGNYNNIEGKVSYYQKMKSQRSESNAEWGYALAAYYKHSDGFFINQYDSSKVDNSDEVGVRIKLDGRNNKGYRNSTFVNYNYVSQGGFPYHQPNQPINYNDKSAYIRHNLIVGTNYTFFIDDYLLSGTTSYQYLNDKMQMDQDYQPLPYFTLIQAQQEHYISQELTLRPRIKKQGKSGFWWDWLTGAQLSYKHQRMSAPVHFFQTGIDSLIVKNANSGIHTAFPNGDLFIKENDFVIASHFVTQATDIAAYHTTYLNWDKWQLEMGLRLDFEYQHFDYLSDATIHYLIANTSITDWRPINSNVNGIVTLPYFEALPKIAVSYKETQWQAHLSIAEGYKAGGFNTQLFSDILQNKMMTDMMADIGVYFKEQNDYSVDEVITYRPERCFTFEAGVAGNKREEKIELEGSATIYELEVINQQVTTFPKVGTGRFMTNAGHSRSVGAELRGSLSWADLTLLCSYGYTYAYFVDYNDGQQDYHGKRVPYVPSNTLSAAAQYCIYFEHDFFNSLTLNVNTNAFGTIYWDENNEYKQPFYALLNANIILKMKYLTFELWGKNLSATKYDVFRFVSMGNTLMQSGKPLTLGAKIKIEF